MGFVRAGGSGGDARGISVLGCTDCLFTGLHIHDLTPGQGGDSGMFAPEGAGGKAVGIYLDGSAEFPLSGTVITESVIENLGLGVRGAFASSDANHLHLGAKVIAMSDVQQGFGLWFQNWYEGLVVDESVLVDGDPVVFRWEASHEVIADLAITSPLLTTRGRCLSSVVNTSRSKTSPSQ